MSDLDCFQLPRTLSLNPGSGFSKGADNVMKGFVRKRLYENAPRHQNRRETLSGIYRGFSLGIPDSSKRAWNLCARRKSKRQCRLERARIFPRNSRLAETCAEFVYSAKKASRLFWGFYWDRRSSCGARSVTSSALTKSI